MRSTRENRRLSRQEKVVEDFFLGQLARRRTRHPHSAIFSEISRKSRKISSACSVPKEFDARPALPVANGCGTCLALKRGLPRNQSAA